MLFLFSPRISIRSPKKRERCRAGLGRQKLRPMIAISPSPPSSPASFSLKVFFPVGGIRHCRALLARARWNSRSFAVSSTASASSGAFQPRLPFQYQSRKPDVEEDEEEDDGASVVGDCLVFEEGAFEVGDPFCSTHSGSGEKNGRKSQSAKSSAEVEVENLVPERWREALEEINMTKKEKRKISLELKFGSRLERRKKLPVSDLDEYRAYREMKLSRLKPVVLDKPREFPPPPPRKNLIESPTPGARVDPKNPRSGIEDEGLDSISNFFNSPDYAPEEIDDDKKPGKRKLFTPEEKILLNKRIPHLADATSSKWLPVHTLAASGEFYLLGALLKHNVDVNAPDKEGLCAIHRAILGNKVAVVSYLLRESANPFVRDRDGATLMHYAVLTASTQIIKTLLLYDVNIDLPDDEGWTPLHLAVQTLRTDVTRLLLIKGADVAAKTREGLTPLDLCLFSGHHARTFELIKLLKKIPRSKAVKL